MFANDDSVSQRKQHKYMQSTKIPMKINQEDLSRPFPRLWIVASGVDGCTLAQMTEQVVGWAETAQSRYVCFCNAHMMCEAKDDDSFQGVLLQADLILPDGRPLVWMLRALGRQGQPQVRGPDGMRSVCQAAVTKDIPVGFFGSQDSVLDGILARAARDFPGLRVGYRYSPPFRPLTPDEDEAIIADINRSGVRILFVGLGCPKQERWMASHSGRIRAVMMGVGAAFDLYAGRVPEAPRWISRLGFEWAYRLAREPRRLLGRNLRTSPRFAAMAIYQLLRHPGASR